MSDWVAGAIVHPGLLLAFDGLLLLWLRGFTRDALVIVVPAAALFFLWQLPDGASMSLSWLGYELIPLKTDKLSRLAASGRKIIGFDLVEVAPGKDEWDANVGARLLYHLCGVLAAK